jgi:hypothetical protein
MMRRPASISDSIQAAAPSALPISSSMSSTGPGAPPWSGPFNEQSAATTIDTGSLSVDAATRAVKVEAFMPWSATVTRYASSASARSPGSSSRTSRA